MRLFLLPISTRRSLIYCERARETRAPGEKQPWSERIINKTSETWIAWERYEKGWQKTVTNWGNQLFKRIPYEEWGLKSIPPATRSRLQEIDDGKLKFECLFPSAFIRNDRVLGVLEKLAKERQALHRQRLLYCLIGMPISAPFMIVPVIPNLPFYYLCYRAYSHYRALYGSKTLEHIVQKQKVDVQPSQVMDELYVAGLLHPNQKMLREAETPSKEEINQIQQVVKAQARGDKEEVMLLKQWNGEVLAEAFHLPEMEVEIQRAVDQVEKAVEKDRLHTQKTQQEAVKSKQS